MGIKTVAVYSDADARAPHVEMADQKVRLGPPPASESYLLAEAILLACKETGAQAVHPGYGFLSERESFRAVAGRQWHRLHRAAAECDRRDGRQDREQEACTSRRRLGRPGFIGEIRDTDHAIEIAGGIGYPVMMKASAGGGGKGMRLGLLRTRRARRVRSDQA